MQKLQRNIAMTFRVTAEERDMIRRRQAQTGILNTRAYLLKMAIDGRVIHVELESVKEMNRGLSNISNNINQVIHCVLRRLAACCNVQYCKVIGVQSFSLMV